MFQPLRGAKREKRNGRRKRLRPALIQQHQDSLSRRCEQPAKCATD
jgi:hypothetical protein